MNSDHSSGSFSKGVSTAYLFIFKDSILSCSTFGPQDNLPSSPEEWVSVIKLARMWEFDGVFENSAEKVAYDSVKLSPVEKVALASQYNIEEWLVPGLYELANRPEPICTKDVDILGLDVALKVAAVRESLHLKMKFGSGTFISGSRDARMIDFTRTIKKIFEMPGGDSLEMVCRSIIMGIFHGVHLHTRTVIFLRNILQ